jgi:REP element-mobilizing transposase RayT
MARKELRHDIRTVSLLADYKTITPKYCGNILVGNVALVVEGIIRKMCKEMKTEIIDKLLSVWHSDFLGG